MLKEFIQALAVILIGLLWILFATGSVFAACLDFGTSTVGVYHLNSTTTDVSDNHHDLTASSTALYDLGILDNAIIFDRTTTFFASTTDTLGIDDHEPYGFSMWVKMNDEIASSYQFFISHQISNVNNDIFYDYNAGVRRIIFRGGDTPYSYNVNLGTSEWHHLVSSFNGTELFGYLDGVLVATGTPSAFNSVGNFTFGIGALFYINVYSYPANAKIDEVVVLNRPITPTEVLWLYNSGNGMQACPLEEGYGDEPAVEFLYPNVTNYNVVPLFDNMAVKLSGFPTDEWYRILIDTYLVDAGTGALLGQAVSTENLSPNVNRVHTIPTIFRLFVSYEDLIRAQSFSRVYLLNDLTGDVVASQELYWWLDLQATSTQVQGNQNETITTSTDPTIKIEINPAPLIEALATTTASTTSPCSWHGFLSSSTAADIKCYLISGGNDTFIAFRETMAQFARDSLYGVARNIFPLSVFYHYNALLSQIPTSTAQDIILDEPQFFGGHSLVLWTSSTMAYVENKVGFDFRSFFDKLFYIFTGLVEFVILVIITKSLKTR